MSVSSTSSNMDAATLFQKGKLLSDPKNFLKSAPSSVMTIEFSGTTIEAGEQIKLSQASTHPGVPTWPGQDSDALYMVVMVDTDAPAKGRDKNTNYLHWLIVNMTGDDMARANLVQKYTPPTPPKGTGPHRYVILAYRQGGKIDHKELQKHLKDGPSSFSLPLLLSVAAHAGSRAYPTLEAGTYFVTEHGDAGMQAIAAPVKSAGISIVTGAGSTSSPLGAKPLTLKSGGMSPLQPGKQAGGKPAAQPSSRNPNSPNATPKSKGGKADVAAAASKMRHLSV